MTMPIITFPDAPPKADGKPADQRIPMIVCTRSDTDAGLDCPFCGWPTGVGHGAKR